jgi:hypothetical protein
MIHSCIHHQPFPFVNTPDRGSRPTLALARSIIIPQSFAEIQRTLAKIGYPDSITQSKHVQTYK